MAALIVLIVLGGVLLFEGYALLAGRAAERQALPANFGNFDRVRAPLEADASREEFSFAMVGDSKCSATFERIVRDLRRDPLAFLVLLGDCVPHAKPRYHRYFISRCARALALPFPVLYTVGNHDVDAEEFPVSQFEATYGPSNFSFGYRGCLFVVLRVLDKPVGPRTTQESLDYLESVLAARRKDFGRVFVFLHVPPSVSRDFASRKFEGSEDLVALCDRHGVDYVVAGDHHGYARVNVGGTAYLVSGGGGSPLREKRRYGVFHHAMVLKVGPGAVSERILLVREPALAVGHGVHRFAVARLWPWLLGNRGSALAINAALVLAWLWALRALLK